MPLTHDALIIEDEPELAQILKDIVTSVGHTRRRSKRHVARSPYVLLDMQIPATEGGRPMVGCGETALAELRAKDSRRNAEGRHLRFGGTRTWTPAAPDALFVVFLRLVAAHTREVGVWTSDASLGLARKNYAPSRIRTAFEDVVPDGFEIVETGGNDRYRLNPNVAVERVDWKAPENPSDDAVQKIARDEMKKR